MYKLIMVDDEDLVLANLSQSFNWNSMGFELAGTFTDADSCLTYLESHTADVVITDIKMPVVSGVELAKQITRLYPPVMIVFLSGYRDFEYAIKGIEIGVFSYLLKPLSYSDVQELCVNMVSVLNQRYASPELGNGFKETVPVALQRAILEYMRKNSNDIQRIKELSGPMGADPASAPLAVLDITLDCLDDYLVNTWHHEKNALYTAIGNLAVSDKIILIPLSTAFDKIEMLAVSKTDSLSMFSTNLSDFKLIFTQNCLDILNLVTIVSIGSTCCGIESLLQYQDNQRRAEAEAMFLFKLIERGKAEKAVERTTELISAYSGTNGYLNMLAYELHRILSGYISHEDCIRLGIYPNTLPFPLRMDPYNVPADVGIMVASMRLTVKNAALFFAGPAIGGNAVMDNVRAYIARHYMESITLADIAACVYMSEYHFCRYFKKNMDMNFIDYLNKVRIEQAQRLLADTAFKTGDICTRVGYSSSKYFHKKFKAITGVTPQEFRKQTLRGNLS